MIITLDKFQAIILDRKKPNLANIPLTIDNETMKYVPSVELLRIHLDDKLHFHLHITYLSFNARRVLINSYINSYFNYFPLVWIFSTAKSLNKTVNLQKTALPFSKNDYTMITQYLKKVYQKKQGRQK